MSINEEAYQSIAEELLQKNVKLVAVSKTKPIEAIQDLYNLGQRVFGENYVQELVEKQPQLPGNIEWHFIGHLQSNKVKYIAPFVSLIQSVDSIRLLKEINKQAQKNNRIIDVLLQVHIAQEETKFGFDEGELDNFFNNNTNDLQQLSSVKICGLMGMASFSDNADLVRKEFRHLKTLFDKYNRLKLPNCQLEVLSMGMSSDYKIAVEEGSTMVRIGSLIFGSRS